MIPPRKEPYERLIEMFLKNVEGAAVANESRFQGMREERLIGEERDFQVEQQLGIENRAEERADDNFARDVEREDFVYGRNRGDALADVESSRGREDEVAARNREDALTDEATRLRTLEANNIRQALAYVDPDSPEYQQALDVINVLLGPNGLTGQAAIDAQLNGHVKLPDGSTVSSHVVMAHLDRAKRVAVREETHSEGLLAGMTAYLEDQERDVAAKISYYNNVVAPNTFITDGMKEGLLTLAGVSDPDMRRAVLQGQELTEAQIDSLEATTAVNSANADLLVFQLEQNERVADIEYGEMQERLRAAILARQLDEDEAFLKYGYLPEEGRTEMANRLGYRDVEALIAGSGVRWDNFKRREAIDMRGAANSADLLGAQVNMAEVQILADQLRYDQSLLYDALERNIGLAEMAMAAARNGDIATIRALEQASLLTDENGNLVHESLGLIEFEGLIALANEYRGDEMSRMEHDRQTRENLMSQSDLTTASGVTAFIEAAAKTFVTSDFTPTADGSPSPFEADIDAYLDGLTTRQLRALGGRDTARSQLVAAARRDYVLRERGEAGALLDVLTGTVPDGRILDDGTVTSTTEQRTWRSQFLVVAEQAGIDSDTAAVIADGLLSAQDRDFYLAMLDAQNIQAEIGLRKAQTDRTNLETDALEAELNADPAVLTDEQYDRNLNGLKAYEEVLKTQLLSAYCTVNAEAGGPKINTQNQAMCDDIYDEFTWVGQQMKRLTDAYNTGSPWALGVYNDQLTLGDRDVEMARAVGILSDMPDVDLSMVDALQAAGSTDLPLLLSDVANGIISDPNEINALLTELMSEYDSFQIQAEQDAASIHQMDRTGAEWRALTPSERLSRISRTPEWRQLVERMARGEGPDDDRGGMAILTGSEEDQLARTFGFTTRGISQQIASSIGADVPRWLEGPGSVDLTGFREALALSVAAFRGENETPRTGARVIRPGGGAVESGTGRTSADGISAGGAPLTPQGRASRELLASVWQQESGNEHFRPDGRLKISPEGAIGASQLMPFTAWRAATGIDPLVEFGPEDNTEMQRLHGIESAKTAVMDATRAGWQAGDPAAAALYEAADSARRTARVEAAGIVERLATEQGIGASDFRRYGQQYLDYLIQRYDGDVEKGLAAYNTGMRNVDRAVAADPTNWLARLHPQTQSYVPLILGRLATP